MQLAWRSHKLRGAVGHAQQQQGVNSVVNGRAAAGGMWVCKPHDLT